MTKILVKNLEKSSIFDKNWPPVLTPKTPQKTRQRELKARFGPDFPGVKKSGIT